MVGRLTLAAFLLVTALETGWTQDVTGELEGWVASGVGSPLPDVRVTATGPSLQGLRHTVSDARGYFHLPALPVGSYRVGFRLIGYRPVSYEEVSVRLATTTSLGRIRLEAQAIELPEIVVSGEVVPLDPTTTATRTNLHSGVLADLPLDRNFRSIVSLAPQANTSFYGDEVICMCFRAATGTSPSGLKKQTPPERVALGGDAVSHLIADICQPFFYGPG